MNRLVTGNCYIFGIFRQTICRFFIFQGFALVISMTKASRDGEDVQVNSDALKKDLKASDREGRTSQCNNLGPIFVNFGSFLKEDYNLH